MSIGSGGSSPLIPLSEYLNREEDANSLNYGSEVGGSLYSNSTATSQQRNHNKRMRVDLSGASNQQRKIQIANSDNVLDTLPNNSSNERTDSKIYIWGTRIVAEDLQNIFRKFIFEYRTLNVDEDENTIIINSGEMVEINLNAEFYMEKLRGISLCEEAILNLNLAHVKEFHEELYKLIIAYPAVII